MRLVKSSTEHLKLYQLQRCITSEGGSTSNKMTLEKAFEDLQHALVMKSDLLYTFYNQ